VTHNRDAARHATAGITVNVDSPIEVTGCQIVVDATQPAVAVARSQHSG
jgi:hypothetical protein